MNVKIQANEIKLIKIENLKQKNGNRNQHPQSQIDALAEHFKYQGFRNPLIISKRSGEIVAGNGRYLAALRAGIKELPVIFQEFESEEQEYAFHVADNGLSGWSVLDYSGINSDVQNLGPDFNIDMLGLKNFAVDISDHGFNPDFNDEIEVKQKTCQHCGEVI